MEPLQTKQEYVEKYKKASIQAIPTLLLCVTGLGIGFVQIIPIAKKIDHNQSLSNMDWSIIIGISILFVGFVWLAVKANRQYTLRCPQCHKTLNDSGSHLYLSTIAFSLNRCGYCGSQVFRDPDPAETPVNIYWSKVGPKTSAKTKNNTIPSIGTKKELLHFANTFCHNAKKNIPPFLTVFISCLSLLIYPILKRLFHLHDLFLLIPGSFLLFALYWLLKKESANNRLRRACPHCGQILTHGIAAKIAIASGICCRCGQQVFSQAAATDDPSNAKTHDSLPTKQDFLRQRQSAMPRAKDQIVWLLIAFLPLAIALGLSFLVFYWSKDNSEYISISRLLFGFILIGIINCIALLIPSRILNRRMERFQFLCPHCQQPMNVNAAAIHVAIATNHCGFCGNRIIREISSSAAEPSPPVPRC